MLFSKLLLILTGFSILVPLSLHRLWQFQDPKGNGACPGFIVEHVGTAYFYHREQIVSFGITHASIQRPLMFSDLGSFTRAMNDVQEVALQSFCERILLAL